MSQNALDYLIQPLLDCEASPSSGPEGKATLASDLAGAAEESSVVSNEVNIRPISSAGAGNDLEAGEGEQSGRSTDGHRGVDVELSLRNAEERLTKLLPEGSRMSIKVTGSSIAIRIPPTDDLVSALDLWSHKKLVLAWGLFMYLLLQYSWSMYHGVYPGYEPFRFGGGLLLFTVFRFSIKLTASGALSEETIELQPQKLVVRRRFFCRTKTASADKCEILDIETTNSGIIVKCAGVGVFGLPKRFLLGRHLTRREREILAAFLRGYVSGTGSSSP